MAESSDKALGPANLNLTPEEKRVYGQLFHAADPDGFGAVSGEVAVTFFEKTKLPGDVLGHIWQIADSENRGLLTPPGFSVVLRLIGHAQAGRAPSAELSTQPGPLPRFDALNLGPALVPQSTGSPAPGPPIRVPALLPEKASEYVALFEKSGAEGGLLPGPTAKQIFEKAKLPLEVLGRIWNLADTQARGALDATDFAIAMHLLASIKSGSMRGVPQTLPAGLYEAASRRAPTRSPTAPYPAGLPAVPGIPRQFTGSSAGRPQSPAVRQPPGGGLSAQSTGDGWAVTPGDKTRFDQIFNGLDKNNQGYITGDQAVEFFGNARLPEETLAQVWDLADIKSEGRLDKDEFAVAMYLIRQQRGGRGNLPATLPPALVPPSLRRQDAPGSQPIHPAFQEPPPKPRSAADDLFGLDVMSSAPPQAAQSTGDSAAGGPFQNPIASPGPTSSPPPSTSFKPFIPSSSFGQSLAGPPSDSPSNSQSRNLPSSSPDLLGDGDPEVSQKLTAETSELANLSNQVGSLAKQTQEIQGTRAATEQELVQSTQQKREFEGRLSQLRALYQKEVADVKTLQGQLNTSRNETKRLQQEAAMVEGSFQDLRNQHQQLSTALEGELREKAELAEKIKIANGHLTSLKPQVEKMKSEARQQKGLVAINKKQLATLDVEKDRLQEELNSAEKDLDQAKREAEEQSNSTPLASAVASPANVASPAPSNASATNPFFRRNTGASDPPFSPPIAKVEESQTREEAFDSMFGPSVPPSQATSPPPIVFPETPSLPRQISTMSSSSASPTSATGPFMVEPPAPPTAGQITSASLPFRAPLDRADSINSSVRVAPSASRLSPADTPRAGTPTASSSVSQNGDPQTPVAGMFSASRGLPIKGGDEVIREHSVFHDSQEVPGAFPDIETPRREQSPFGQPVETESGPTVESENAPTSAPKDMTGSDKQTDNTDADFDQYFGGPAHARSHSQKAADFDSAFANLQPASTNGTVAKDSEFPPIREIEDDSDDSDDGPTGFDDDFTAASNSKGKSAVTGNEPTEAAGAVGPSLLQARPHLETSPSNASSLPGIAAQTSPPTYGDSVPTDNPDHFPPEFKGLLPRRTDPTSAANEPTHSMGEGTGAPVSRTVSQSYGPEVAKSTSPPVSVPLAKAQEQKTFFGNDFDDAFAGMEAAPEADDDDDDTDTNLQTNHGSEFDPTFDSPAPSKSTTSTRPGTLAGHMMNNSDASGSRDMSATNAFYNFSSSVNSQPAADTPAPPTSGGNKFKDSEWDDMFSNLDKSPAIPSAPAPATPPKSDVSQPQRPAPNRAISMGTEHDDPILKRLTSMGWSRDESLKALEKFDYNIDKAADYLTFKE